MVEVSRLAKLARLGIKEEEVNEIQQELSGVLDYVSKLQNFSVSPHGDGEQFLSTPYLPKDVVREDVSPHLPGIFTDKILENAPEVERNFIRVKKIL